MRVAWWTELFSPFGKAEGDKCDDATILAPMLGLYQPLGTTAITAGHQYHDDPGRPNRVLGPLHLDLLTREHGVRVSRRTHQMPLGLVSHPSVCPAAEYGNVVTGSILPLQG